MILSLPRSLLILADPGTPPLPPHITTRGTPPTLGKSQHRRGSGSIPKLHPSSSPSTPKADNMVSYEDMIRNSPRNTPKLPQGKPPPAPQKSQSSGAIEAVGWKQQSLTSSSPSAAAVSSRKPPTPARVVTTSVKKPRAPSSSSESSPRIMEGVKLRESK